MDNTVELIGFYGSDETHALSAWTSTSRDLTPAKRARIPSLLKDTLMADKDLPHSSPFEKSFLHFLVTSDIATHIHIIKHRIAVSVNAESARYKEIKDDRFYIPVDWPGPLQDFLEDSVRKANLDYHWLIKELVKAGFSRSRAKESARFVRPYASQLTQDVSFNFLSFMHFQKLRNSKHAQLEVRQIAQGMLQLVRDTGAFDASLEAFGWPAPVKVQGVQLSLFPHD